MGAFSKTSLGDIVRGANRYRPVAVTVAVVVVVAVALGPIAGSDDGGDTSPAALTAGVSNGAASVSPTTEAPDLDATDTADAGTGGGETAAPTTSPSPTQVSPVRPREGGGPSSDDAPSGDDGGSSPSPAPAPDASLTFTPTPTDEQPAPLTVRDAGWATAQAGTPLAANGVPEGTLPVGNRLGQPDKESYVRLSGTETVLTLATDTAGERAAAGDPAVQACLIVDAGWEAAEAMSFDDAPEVYRDNCVTGTVTPAGAWQFDLSSFGDPTDDRGFALIASPDAPFDFQVTFRRD